MHGRLEHWNGSKKDGIELGRERKERKEGKEGKAWRTRKKRREWKLYCLK